MDLVKSQNEKVLFTTAQHQKINDLKATIKNHEQTISELRERINDMERDVIEKVRSAREVEWAKISAIEVEKSDLEKQLSDAQRKLAELEASDVLYRRDVASEHHRLKKQAAELTSGSGLLQSSNSNLLTENNRYKQEAENHRHNMSELNMELTNTANQLEAVKRQFGTCLDNLTTSEATLKEANGHLERLTDKFDKEQQAFEHIIERQRVKFTQQIQDLSQKLELAKRDNLDAVIKINDLDGALGQQQSMFESKIFELRERVKASKAETAQMR